MEKIKESICRCKWCNINNESYIEYHDKEWGVPCYDDQILLEFLILEPFQAGLSWEIVLNKREGFREAFDGYCMETICNYGTDKIEQLLQDKSIIRNRRKIEAAIWNTKIFREIQKEWGTFSEYLWHFTKGEIKYEIEKTSSELSDCIAKDLKKRGMKFIGTTIIYSYLQAMGVVYSHEKDCFLYNKGDKSLS